MTTIRHISASELRSYSQFAACEDRGFAPSSPAEFETWLKSLWESGKSAPDRCFLAECDGQPLAAVVYWTRGKSAHLEHVRLPVDDPHLLDILLTESIARLRENGTSSIWAELVTPPLREPRATILAACLERIGFGKGRERRTFLWKPDAGAAAASGRLTFRSLAELGKEAFVTALAEMTADSLDAGIAADRSKKGPLIYAADEFVDQALTHHEASWWEIAYDQAGTAVGIVLVGVVGRQPAILFIAVALNHRGHRFTRDLLARGISTLVATGAESVRGDMDAANVPMVQAFGAVGFSQIRTCRWFEREIR